MKRFEYESMLEIVEWCEDELSKLNSYAIVAFQVPDADISNSSYPYRSFKVWGDLATLLFCRMLTPHTGSNGYIVIRFQKLDRENSFHIDNQIDDNERYGIGSKFAEIDKNNQPTFLWAYREALHNVKIAHKKQVLNLGINSGDEFEFIRDILPRNTYKSIQFIGVDYSKSVIDRARERFHENSKFYCHDINKLDELNLSRSDLIISIGTLQSRDIEFKPLFMSLVQKHLTTDGSIILGFPNCRWIDGEMIYGAKAPNYSNSELSLVIKDIYFCKKYLQQHRFRVTITGREYLFLTATKIGIIKTDRKLFYLGKAEQYTI